MIEIATAARKIVVTIAAIVMYIKFIQFNCGQSDLFIIFYSELVHKIFAISLFCIINIIVMQIAVFLIFAYGLGPTAE